MTDSPTRAGLEQHLLELTGFKRDTAEIAAFMDAIDIYAAYLADQVTEPFLHLLSQQAELLLDSGASITKRLEDLERRASWTERAIASHQAVVEITEAEREMVRAHLETEPSADELLPGWERELLEQKLNEELAEAIEQSERGETVDLGSFTRYLELDDLVRIIDGEVDAVYCRSCDLWKEPGDFYRNTKSRTGFEGKCKHCGRANKAHAA